jgi:hypothetical protein
LYYEGNQRHQDHHQDDLYPIVGKEEAAFGVRILSLRANRAGSVQEEKRTYYRRE